MHQLRNYTAIALDCDGVILDSNATKITAMRLALESHPQIISGESNALTYFKNNFGKSRHHHVTIFLRKFLVVDPACTESQLKTDIIKAYEKHLARTYPQAALVEGVTKFFNKYKGSVFVASASDQSELRELLPSKLPINKLNIFGSPRCKSDLLTDLLSREALGRKDLLFIGDSVSDAQTALKLNLDFIGLSGRSNTPNTFERFCKGSSLPYFKTWCDLLKEA
jgi:phosphoglycolate phosphatase-like HAD superfamily hydrolase